jgi:5'-nucleotidase
MRLLPLALLLGLVGCDEDLGRPLILLHTTDEHSHLFGFGPELDDFPTAAAAGSTLIGGVGRRAAVLSRERARAAAQKIPTLTVSSGDNTQGTLMEVATPFTGVDFAVLKQLGYDASTLGNHEFDRGPDALAAAITTAQQKGGMPPVLASNINFNGAAKLQALYDDTGSDASKPLHKSLVLTASNGLKVGFVGIVGGEAAALATEKAPITFSVPPSGDASDYDAVVAQIAVDLQPIVDKLRKQVDLVVLLSHAGMDDPMTSSEDYKLAQVLRGVDVIISGHTHLVIQAQTITSQKTGARVIIQGAGKYGEHVGRLSLHVAPGKVTLDSDTAMLDVTGQETSDPTYDPTLVASVDVLEKTKLAGASTTFLEQTLSEIMAPTKVTDDASKAGDLFFYPIVKTDFDLSGDKLHDETPLSVLIADADLAAADKYSGGKTDVSMVGAGAVRDDLKKGRTGQVTFNDIFRTVPLGVSPKNQSIGYPLVRFAIYLAETKAAFEVTAGYSYLNKNNGDYFLTTSGMQYFFDTSRAIFNNDTGSPLDAMNGRVTKFVESTDHSKLDTFDKPLFDVNDGGWKGSPLDPVIVVTNFYIARFAYIAGVKLKDPVTKMELTSPGDAILHRPDGSEIKEWEALAEFLQAQGASNAGKIPARYNATAPRRAFCTGPLCVK